jgi:hypothetical protein
LDELEKISDDDYTESLAEERMELREKKVAKLMAKSAKLQKKSAKLEAKRAKLEAEEAKLVANPYPGLSPEMEGRLNELMNRDNLTRDEKFEKMELREQRFKQEHAYKDRILDMQIEIGKTLDENTLALKETAATHRKINAINEIVIKQLFDDIRKKLEE